jgi:hypothetical protein
MKDTIENVLIFWSAILFVVFVACWQMSTANAMKMCEKSHSVQTCNYQLNR